MEQFGFDTLNENVQLQLLKYMPIKERVRFERINTHWARLLDTLWLSQSGIHFGMRLDSKFKCHIINRSDRTMVKDTPPEVMFKIVTKCKNLKALDIDSERFDEPRLATQLASVLNYNCNTLDHLDTRSINLAFFELFIPSYNFTCLSPLVYDRLEQLYDWNNYVGTIALKSLDFWAYDIDPRMWSLINKMAAEHVFSRYWSEEINELINLKSLFVMEGESEQIGNFHQLEHIGFKVSTMTGLSRIFDNNRKLVSLTLLSRADEVIEGIVTLGLNLRKLDIYMSKVAMFDDYQFWLNLAKLTKLRSFLMHAYEDQEDLQYPWDRKLVDMKLNANGLALLLGSCTKLKVFELWCYSSVEDITTELEKEQIRKVVAKKSFRQSLVVSILTTIV